MTSKSNEKNNNNKMKNKNEMKNNNQHHKKPYWTSLEVLSRKVTSLGVFFFQLNYGLFVSGDQIQKNFETKRSTNKNVFCVECF